MVVVVRNLQKRIPISYQIRLKIKKAVRKTLSLSDIKYRGEITVCLVNDTLIREVNLQYLGENTPTDVITFDLSPKQKNKLIADMIISTDTAVVQARKFRTSPLNELYMYVIHGILHLLGDDHKDKRQRRIMDKKTNQILKGL